MTAALCAANAGRRLAMDRDLADVHVDRAAAADEVAETLEGAIDQAVRLL